MVPSPHSSSCVRLSSIMFFAAGCATSISRKIALPSFVRLARTFNTEDERTIRSTYRIPPIGSKIILSMAFGPRHVRMTSATVYHSEESVTDIKINYDVVCTFAAVMLEICAFRPDCLSGAVSARAPSVVTF